MTPITATHALPTCTPTNESLQSLSVSVLIACEPAMSAIAVMQMLLPIWETSEMTSGMGIVMRNARIRAQVAAEKQAVNTALSSLASGGNPRVVRSVAKTMLLNSPYFYNGMRISVLVKSIGAGVYQLSMEQP
jgi:hypothetical protein